MEHKRLEDDYTNAFHTCCKLFSEDFVLDSLPRLNEIYSQTEERWEANIQRLIANNVKLKYLLIGEAAPWTRSGHVKYFYNGDFKGLGDAILPGFSIDTSDTESIYQELARKQFILIDSLPFSFSYSSQIRSRPAYKQLVKECTGYFKNKLYDSRLQWESEVKVGFGYTINARKVMEVLGYQLNLPNGQTVTLNDNMIVADGSGFPHAPEFRRIFGV